MSTRTLTITEERVRAYSRRGNYHSDPETSTALGLDRLVAQGMQAAGPACAELIDAWGDAFFSGAEIDLRFVGVVHAGDTVTATVAFDDAAATIEVSNDTAVRTAVTGVAHIMT
jgi:acyl dehydratase